MTREYSAPESIAHSRVLVVGAASGMGREIADHLVRSGANVMRADRPGAQWDSHLPASRLLAMDVTDLGAVREAVVACEAALGALDAVVNCAGVLGKVEALAVSDPADFQRQLEVNLLGAFLLSREVMPRMAARGYGRVVHIASIAGKEGNPQMAGYSASKAGVIAMAKALGKEFADTGVTINTVAPASIDTPLLDGMSPERREVQKSLIPMRRFGTVQEAATLVEFIISPGNSFTTGFAYDLSGGRATY